MHIQPVAENARLATGGQDAKIKLWSMKPILEPNAENDPTVPKYLSTLSLHTGAVIGSDDHKIVIWEKDRSGFRSSTFGESDESVNVESWRGIKVLSGHESDVADLAWSPENEYLASCALDSQIIIWDCKTFDKVKKLDAHRGFVKGITWDPVGKFLASQSDDRTVKIWNTADWKVHSEITDPYVSTASTTFFRRLSWSPEGSSIITANGENGNIPVAPIISREDWSTHVSLVGHQAPIEVALFNPVLFDIPIDDNEMDEGAPRALSAICATGSQDKGICVWWTSKSYCAASAQDVFKHSVLDLTWSPDGYVLMACSYDGTVAGFLFTPAEFGSPISSEEKISALVKYGYKKQTKIVPESVMQLELEDAYRASKVHEQIPTFSKTSQQESLPTPHNVPSLSSSTFTAQKETRLADGRRRIKPMFVQSLQQDSVETNTSFRHSGPSFTDMRIPTGSMNDRSGGMVGDKRQNTEYVLPTIMQADATTILAVPSISNRLILEVSRPRFGEDGLDFVTLECKNTDKGAKVVSVYKGSVEISIQFKHAVLHMKAGEGFYCFSCADASIHVLSFAGRRLLPAMCLPACASFVDACDKFLMAITCVGTVYIWDIQLRKALLAHEPLSPILPPMKSQTESKLTLPTIVAAFIRKDGQPIIKTSTLATYTYLAQMGVWIDITHTYLEELSEATGGGLAEKSFKKLTDVEQLSYIENCLAIAELMESPTDFRKWLSAYAERVSEEGSVAKAREICEMLLRNASNRSFEGFKAFDGIEVLKEILTILGSKRKLQHTVENYWEYLRSLHL
ncbi:WD40-repeat-containing domain protein [Chytridium lagenaria]|nr:WD40-repeat-containing domain protein [Chytridium lagenaria]